MNLQEPIGDGKEYSVDILTQVMILLRSPARKVPHLYGVSSTVSVRQLIEDEIKS